MKRRQFCLPDDLMEALRRLSKRTGAPMAEHVRRAIDEYLKKLKQ